MRFWIIFIVVSIISIIVFRNIDLPSVQVTETVTTVVSFLGFIGVFVLAGKLYNK